MQKNRSSFLYIACFFAILLFLDVPCSFAQTLKIAVVRSDSNFVCYSNKLKYTVAYATWGDDSLVTYQAQRIGDIKVIYVKSFFEKKERLHIYHEDRDFGMLRELLDLSSQYRRESYQAECSTSMIYRYIDWGTDRCGLIGPIYCATPLQKIYWIDKRIREWFESKFPIGVSIPK